MGKTPFFLSGLRGSLGRRIPEEQEEKVGMSALSEGGAISGGTGKKNQ